MQNSFSALSYTAELYQLKCEFLRSVTQSETWILKPADNLTFIPTWKQTREM